MSHYDVEREESEASGTPALDVLPDMTPAEALRLIRERCPAREWNVVLESEIYQYSARWLGESYEQPPVAPAIRFSCTVWLTDEKPHRCGAGTTLRDAVNEALALLPPVPAACELKLMAMEGVA